MSDSNGAKLTRLISYSLLNVLLIALLTVNVFQRAKSVRQDLAAEDHIRQIVRDEIAQKEFRERMAPIQAEAEMKQKEADLEKDAIRIQEEWNKLHQPSVGSNNQQAVQIPASTPTAPAVKKKKP